VTNCLFDGSAPDLLALLNLQYLINKWCLKRQADCAGSSRIEGVSGEQGKCGEGLEEVEVP
jgi:hypothetical protein